MTRRNRLRRQKDRITATESRPVVPRPERTDSFRGRRARLLAALSAVAVLLAVSFWLWKTYGSGNRGSETPSGSAADNQGASLHLDKDHPGVSGNGSPRGHNAEKPPGHTPGEAPGANKEPDNF